MRRVSLTSVVDPRRVLGVALLLGLASPGCGDDSGGAVDESNGPTDGSEDGRTTSADTANTSGTSGSGGPQTGDGSTTSGGETDGPPPPLASCDDTQLPPRDGAEIVVSPGEAGMVMVDGVAMTLRDAVSSASPGDTVLLEDGTYALPQAGDGDYTGVFITNPDITLRSVSGNPEAVIIDGGYVSQGNGSSPITIDASGVVVADITVQRSIFQLIHLWADGDGAIIHNVHMVDGGQQFLKASVERGTVDDVEVSCTSFVMTSQGRDNVWGYGPQDGSTRCYTGGIDTHNARDWNVHDSFFEGIYCDANGVQRPAHGQFPELRDNMTYNGGLAEHCIHMWDSESGTGHVIARNRILDCGRGIGIGLVDTVYGTRVINNMVSSTHAASGEHDVGIIVERAVDTVVAHNSVVLSHPDAYPNAIEYRWAETSNLTMHGNLTNRAITARNDATASDTDNVVDAVLAWFTNADIADLHLVDCDAPGSAATSAVTEDFDGDLRGDPTTPGADECDN